MLHSGSATEKHIMKYTCNIIDLSKIDYRKAYYQQKRIVDEVKFKLSSDTVLLCEHFPVITLGRTGKIDNLLVDTGCLKEYGIDFFKIDRGGDITAHEPGQLIVYPIFDLKQRNEKDIRLYLNRLQQVVKSTLLTYSIETKIIEGITGVWVEKRKIASIGIGISQWITYHGLTINVNNSLKTFSFIRPCGMDIEMTSVANELNKPVDFSDFKSRLINSFIEIFNLKASISQRQPNKFFFYLSNLCFNLCNRN